MKKLLLFVIGLIMMTITTANAQNDNFKFTDLHGIWIAKGLYNSLDEYLPFSTPMFLAMTSTPTADGFLVGGMGVSETRVKLPYMFNGSNIVLFFNSSNTTEVYAKLRIISITPKEEMIAYLDLGEKATKFRFIYTPLE